MNFRRVLTPFFPSHDNFLLASNTLPTILTFHYVTLILVFTTLLEWHTCIQGPYSCGQSLFVNAASSRVDPYQSLGVKRSASKDEIKRAYRQLSIKFHPDKNPGDDAAEKFSEIVSAYEILSDDEKRSIYDRDGYEGLERAANMPQSNNGDHFGDFFSFFGGGDRRSKKEESHRIKLSVTLEQLYFGETFEAKYNRLVLCPNYRACLAKDKNCSGPKVKTILQQFGPGMVVQNQVSDPDCVSSGKRWDKYCKKCKDGVRSYETTTVTVTVHKGMHDKDIITFNEIGDESLGLETGDLIISIQEIPHPRFVRANNDLKATLILDLLDSLVGFEIGFKNLNGKTITIKREGVTFDGEIIIMPDQGMPIKGTDNFGKLYLTTKIRYPLSITNNQKALLKEALENVQYRD